MTTTSKREPRLLVEGLVFGEAPRWRDGQLWFSDWQDECVHVADALGNDKVVLELPGQRPSGLGFLPDGSLLVVSVLDSQVLRWRHDGLSIHADLSDLVENGCNDMVVDSQGRAYVGSWPEPPRQGVLVLVEPDGAARVVAEEIDFPNGCVITAEGTLLLAESIAQCYTEFDIGNDGALTNRRVFAETAPDTPDGICIDAEGAVWGAMTMSHSFVRTARGGAVLDRIELDDRFCVACELGGPDGRTLFMLSSDDYSPNRGRDIRNATIHAIEVEVPRKSLAA